MEKKGETEMKVMLDVPYFSQNSDDVEKEWHDSACGIAAVKMVVDFMCDNSPTMTQLIDEGVAIKGFSDHGWLHESMVRLLRNHGVMSYAQEFRSVSVTVDPIHGTSFLEGKFDAELAKVGLQKIILKLATKKPVIVSVDRKFNDNSHTHLVVIVGYDSKENKLYYHDPDSRKGTVRRGASIKVPDFLKHWRRLAIFVD